MKRTLDTLTGKPFDYNEVVSYLGRNVPGRTTSTGSTQLAPDRVAPDLLAELNPTNQNNGRSRTA